MLAFVEVSDIGGSLQHGPCLSKTLMRLFLGVFIVDIIVGPVLVVSCFFCWDEIGIAGLIVLTLMVGLVLTVSLYFIIHNQKLKYRYRQWLQDAELIRAYSSTVDSLHCFGQLNPEVAILVKFRYLDKNFCVYSKKNNKIKRYKLFDQYADRYLLIAYSPIYDQVMLIKPKSEQRIRNEMPK